jgi:hypothetical protein
MLTLIVCLFQDFIYIQYNTKKKHNKNILLIKQRKNEKNKIIKHIKENNLNFHNRWEKKKMRWNVRGEKWTEGAVAEIYIAVLPMTSLTDYLNNIIFNYFINEFSKVR